jgi:hypothetical protein
MVDNWIRVIEHRQEEKYILETMDLKDNLEDTNLDSSSIPTEDTTVNHSLRLLDMRVFLYKNVVLTVLYAYFTLRIVYRMKTCENYELPMHLIFYTYHFRVLKYYFGMRIVKFLCFWPVLKLENPRMWLKVILSILVTIKLSIITVQMATACHRLRTDTFDNYYDGYIKQEF